MSITINGTTGIAGTNGSAGTPAVQGEDTNTGIFFPAADTVAVATAGTERLRVDSSGNVGIGNSNPTARLEVVTSSGTAAAKIWSATNTTPIADLELQRGTNATWGADAYGDYRLRNDAGALLFQYGESSTTTERMRIDSSGNVGIGTSSPGYLLHVQADASPTIASTDTTNTITTIVNSSNTAGVLGTATNHPLALITNNTERARIDSSGNLLVGTTDFSNITGGNTAGVALQSAGTVWGARADASGVFNRLTSNGIAVELRRQGVTVGSISVTTTATAYNTSSDYRLKGNVQPMQDALGKIAQLNPVTYTWKADGSAGQGFIAHELQAVVPDCVTGEKDAVDAEGNPQYQGVDTSFLVATLVKAIQELTARVAELEAR